VGGSPSWKARPESARRGCWPRADRAREAGLEVLSARAIELEQELSYGVVRQLFEPMLAALPAAERDGLLSGPASPAAAVLDPTRPLEEPSGGNPDASFSTLHALYWITASVAARRPLLLSIDDLHCCDLPSLRWLSARTRPSAPCWRWSPPTC
jgi:hypothetical protein